MSIEHTDVLIAGAGLSGARVAEGLRAAGLDGRIVVAGAEQHGPYERPALSKRVLLGECPVSAIGLRPDAYWREHAIELRTGQTIDSIDIGARRATAGGRQLRWGRLVLATGVRARRIPDLEGFTNVHYLRTADDAANLRDALLGAGRLAVIGAGFVGLEAASAALKLGVDVCVVDPAPVPFLSTLGPAVGHLMAQNATDAGVDLRLTTSIARVLSESGRVVALELQDGSRVDCDAVLVGIGSLPNSQIAAGSLALAADRGIITDVSGRTSADGVYACGDVAAARRANGSVNRIEHWSAAAWSARAVACAIVGTIPPEPVPAYFWTDQFGRRLQVAGHVDPRLDPAMDGSEEGFVAHYRDAAGRLLAVALLDRPEQLSGARRELIASNDPSPLSSAVL
jgi:3-phenylpropionate/trans-cinnamate dioxygenase ferredoxin reductase component